MTTTDSARGETSAQTVIILPVLLLLLWVGVHSALLLHSANVASAVADVVARRAAALGGADEAELGGLAETTADELGAEMMISPRVRYGGDSVTVTVTLRGPTLVPFLPDRVSRASTAPIERFLTAEERR